MLGFFGVPHFNLGHPEHEKKESYSLTKTSLWSRHNCVMAILWKKRIFGMTIFVPTCVQNTMQHFSNGDVTIYVTM
jgi:hypothetical protein